MKRTTARAVAAGIALSIGLAAPAAAQIGDGDDVDLTATTSSEVEVEDEVEDDPTSTPSESTPTTTEETTSPTSPATSPTKPTPVADTPEIRTSAGEREDNKVEVGATIVDTVTYSGLTPGETYTLEATTADVAENTGRDSDEYLLLPNTGETEFVADESGAGRVDVEIEITEAADELVVFEALLDSDGRLVAEHRDATDRSQTVGRAGSDKATIRTNASLDTDNVIQSGANVSDEVTYEGLVPGTTYRLESSLMCTETGEATGAEQTTEFTAEAISGKTTVTAIAVTDPDCAIQTVFQKMYDATSGALVASHEDINDAAQTVGGDEAGKKKKKKKPEHTPEAPELAGKPNPVGTGGPSAPRQTIASVPSGDAVAHGLDLFSR